MILRGIPDACMRMEEGRNYWLAGSRGEGGELKNFIIPELLKLSNKYEVPKEYMVNAYNLYWYDTANSEYQLHSQFSTEN